MFSHKPNYTKLRTNLRLCINRLKLMEKKKTELALKARREIADFIAAGKEDRARIRVEHIVREDYLVEAMEIIEMFCDMLLARFGMIERMAELDPGIEEAISTIIWATPRLASDIQELQEVSRQLTLKYGKEFAEMCQRNQFQKVNEKVLHRIGLAVPPKLLIENYMIEIAKSYKVPFEPDPMVMMGEPPAVDNLVDLGGSGGMCPYPPGGSGGMCPYPPADFTPGSAAPHVDSTVTSASTGFNEIPTGSVGPAFGSPTVNNPPKPSNSGFNYPPPGSGASGGAGSLAKSCMPGPENENGMPQGGMPGPQDGVPQGGVPGSQGGTLSPAQQKHLEAFGDNSTSPSNNVTGSGAGPPYPTDGAANQGFHPIPGRHFNPFDAQMSWPDENLPPLPPYEEVVNSPTEYPSPQSRGNLHDSNDLLGIPGLSPGGPFPPVPAPRSGSVTPNLPDVPSDPTDDLPSVPSSGGAGGSGSVMDDANFDDLTRRFEELKRRK